MCTELGPDKPTRGTWQGRPLGSVSPGKGEGGLRQLSAGSSPRASLQGAVWRRPRAGEQDGLSTGLQNQAADRARAAGFHLASAPCRGAQLGASPSRGPVAPAFRGDAVRTWAGTRQTAEPRKAGKSLTPGGASWGSGRRQLPLGPSRTDRRLGPLFATSEVCNLSACSSSTDTGAGTEPTSAAVCRAPRTQRPALVCGPQGHRSQPSATALPREDLRNTRRSHKAA